MTSIWPSWVSQSHFLSFVIAVLVSDYLCLQWTHWFHLALLQLLALPLLSFRLSVSWEFTLFPESDLSRSCKFEKAPFYFCLLSDASLPHASLNLKGWILISPHSFTHSKLLHKETVFISQQLSKHLWFHVICEPLKECNRCKALASLSRKMLPIFYYEWGIELWWSRFN